MNALSLLHYERFLFCPFLEIQALLKEVCIEAAEN